MREAGRNGADANAIAREFLRPDHAHGFDSRFRRAVVALPGVADPGNAGDVDDHAAIAVLDHVRGGLARAQKHGAEIHVDHGVPLIHRHAADDRAVLDLHQQAVAHDAGVVHQAVQAAEVRRNARHGGADLGLIGDVHPVFACLYRLGRAQPGRLFQVGRVQIE